MHEQWIEFHDGVEPYALEPGVYEAEVKDRGQPATARLRRTEFGWFYDGDLSQPIDAATLVILRVRRLAD